MAYGLAALTGVLYFVGYPGVDIWPLSFVALVPLIIALRGQKTKRCTGLGWVAGMGMTMCGFYWLREMLVTFSQLPEPVPTLLMTLLCAYQSGRIALCGFIYGRAANNGWPAELMFAGAFAASELLYPLLFPWFYGASVHNALPLLQTAELGGPILVAMVLVAPNLAVANLIECKLFGQRLSRSILAAGVAIPAVAAAWGAFRISQIQTRQAESETVKVGLVQGNQGLKEKGKATRKRHRRLTADAVAPGAQLVVWSEAAVDVGIQDPKYAKMTKQHISQFLDGVPTIIGTFVYKQNPEGHPVKWTAFNSAIMADDAGEVTGRYDKQFLLMFGEYLPLGDRFPSLYGLSPNSGALTKGTSLAPLPNGEHRLATTICYEDIIPSFFNDLVREGNPDLLVNLTNDAWFGDSTEPWIHLALAKLRSVEHRKYLVRATNTGVSAIVDATGAVVVHGGTFKEEVVVGEARYMPGGTVYKWLGDKLWWLVALMMIALSVARRPAKEAADSDK